MQDILCVVLKLLRIDISLVRAVFALVINLGAK